MISPIPSAPYATLNLLPLEKQREILYKAGSDAFLLQTTQGYKHAVVYWKKAAKIGDISSIFNLGLMYENGKGVKKSLKIAATYYSRANQNYNHANQHQKRNGRHLAFLIDFYELQKIE